MQRGSVHKMSAGHTLFRCVNNRLLEGEPIALCMLIQTLAGDTMFTNRERHFGGQESALMVAALLTRSYTHVVLPSDAAPKEKTAYRQTIESLTCKMLSWNTLRKCMPIYLAIYDSSWHYKTEDSIPMFKNKDAALLTKDLLAINTLLNYSLQRVQNKCSPANSRYIAR